MLKKPTEYERDIPSKKFTISRQVSPNLLLGGSAGICQRTLVDESGVIKAQERTREQEMTVVHGTHCMIPLCNSNQ
jgi:hypothetical protein